MLNVLFTRRQLAGRVLAGWHLPAIMNTSDHKARLSIDGQFGSVMDFSTKALAEKHSPERAPESIRTLGYTYPGDGGGAIYRMVREEPRHRGRLSITLSDNTLVWYELSAEFIPNVRAWGATPGIDNDATSGIQALLDYYSLSTSDISSSGGGLVDLGDGLYRTSASLIVKSPNVKFRGNGHRNLQRGLDGARAEHGPATIYCDHDGNGITLSNHYEINGFSFERATLVNSRRRPAGSKGICFVTINSAFRREFLIQEASIGGFENALYLSRTPTGLSSMGVLRVTYCNIMYNGAIHRQDIDTQWNHFVFACNDAGQNATLGISVRAHTFDCHDNVLEGQPDPVSISGSFRASHIYGNYFERNSGTACITAVSIRAGHIGPNMFDAVETSYKVLLESCRGVEINDPAWIRNSSLCRLPFFRSARNSTPEEEITAPQGHVVWGHYDRAPVAFVRPTGSIWVSEFVFEQRDQWLDGRVIGVRECRSRPGEGVLSFPDIKVKAANGEFIVATLLIKYDNPPSISQFEMLVNGGYDRNAGSSAGTFVMSSVPTGEWMVLTLAIRALEDVTHFDINFYPWGRDPVDGLYCKLLPPVLTVTAHPSAISPYYDIERATKQDTAPKAGTWNVGDTIFHSMPGPAGNVGWVCVGAGTPGAWRKFGTIATR